MNERKRIIFNFLTSVIILLSGCSRDYIIKSKIGGFDNKILLLPQPIFLYELYDFNTDEERFDKNLFIGSIHFGGGFIRNKDKGMRVQAKKRSFAAQNELEKRIKKKYHRKLIEYLREEEINYKNYTNAIKKDFINLTGEEDIKEQPDDNHDNICLPRINYYADHVEPIKYKEILNENNADYLMIPVIEYYYGHNGGFFNEQNFGCAAGARISIHLYVYDMKTGIPVFVFQGIKKKLYEWKFKLSVFQIKQELEKLEVELFDDLESALP